MLHQNRLRAAASSPGPLHDAVAGRRGDTVAQLLKAGCRADAPGDRGRSALHVAASGCCDDMLEILLRQAGAASGIDARDACDMTALHIAASRPQGAACARRLIRAGADVNAPGPFGIPPLLCAANYGHARTRRILARHGAQLTRGALSEMSIRSTLAHLFGIGGATVIDGRRVSLESAYPEGTFALLGDAVAALANTGAELDRQSVRWLLDAAGALMRAGENIGTSPKALRARIASGETVILPTGMPCHCTACVWVKSRALWCDRLLQPSVVPMRYRVSVARIGRLQSSGVAWRWRGPGRMAATHLRTWLMWRARRRATILHTPKRQHVGNCAMASAKAALWAVLEARASRRGMAHHVLYKTATTFARFYYLRAYLTRDYDAGASTQDLELAAACVEKLIAPKRRVYLTAQQWAQVSAWRSMTGA